MMKRTSRGALACLLLLLLPPLAIAGEDSTETAATPVAGGSATRVFVDPQTGQVGGPPPGVSPPGLSVAEQQMLSRSPRGLQQRTLPGGAVFVDLEGRFTNMSSATLAPQGGAVVSCSDSEDGVTHALHAGAAGGDE